MPRRIASSVCSRRRSLPSGLCAASRTGRAGSPSDSKIEPTTVASEMSKVVGEIGRVDPPGEFRPPGRRVVEASDAGGEQAAARELRRPPQRDSFGGAKALHVPPHVASLHRIEVERRIIPSLALKDRPEQERLPFDCHSRAVGKPLDARSGDIRVRARELEPELQAPHLRSVILERLRSSNPRTGWGIQARPFSSAEEPPPFFACLHLQPRQLSLHLRCALAESGADALDAFLRPLRDRIAEPTVELLVAQLELRGRLAISFLGDDQRGVLRGQNACLLDRLRALDPILEPPPKRQQTSLERPLAVLRQPLIDASSAEIAPLSAWSCRSVLAGRLSLVAAAPIAVPLGSFLREYAPARRGARQLRARTRWVYGSFGRPAGGPPRGGG